MKQKILGVRIERVADTNPDTRYLGEYTDTASNAAICRCCDTRVADLPDDHETPPRGREFRYFLPAMSGEETGNPDSPLEDYRRMEDLNNGQWFFCGVIAKAEVILTGNVTQTLRSGGLWGIESDSGEDYFAEVEREELSCLRGELEACGFGKRAIDYAFRIPQHRAQGRR